MSSLSQTSWLCSLHNPKTLHLSTPKSTNFFPSTHKITSLKTIKIIAFTVQNSKDESLPEPTSSNAPQTPKESTPDRIKLAFEKAQKYKKSLGLNKVQQVNETPTAESGGNGSLKGDGDVGKEEIREVVTVTMEGAGNYEKNRKVENSDSVTVKSKFLSEDKDDSKEEVPEAIRIAMEKAREYKTNKGKVDEDKSFKERDQLPEDVGDGKAEVPEAIRIAMGKASEYKKNKGLRGSSGSSLKNSNLTGGQESDLRDETVQKETNLKEGLKVSSIDFVGLSFSDKKSGRGLPAGLVPVVDPFPEGDFQDVEIIVGDASMFGNATSSETEKISEEESSDLYKPKVSTWGMFPRPSNISEAFGGGRTLRPGEALETEDDRAAKEARTKQLLAAYKRKMGLNMDPKLKAECEKALNDGNSLMDGGRLKEALPFYQKVMDSLPFQTELHGLAALQWSVCQDSLTRTEEARSMYEKLQSHPTGQVSKKARQFMFSFQAMKMMKVTQSTASPRNTGYGSYFEAFVEDKTNYTSGSTDVNEDAVSQALPYIIILLASPILLVLLVAATKGM